MMLDSMRSTPVVPSSILYRFDQLGRIQPELAYPFRDARPFLGQKMFSFALHQAPSRTFDDEHPDATTLFHQLVVDQRLIGLRNCKRIDLKIDRDLPNRRQRLAFLQCAVKNGRDRLLAQLPVDRLVIVPVLCHQKREMLGRTSGKRPENAPDSVSAPPTRGGAGVSPAGSVSCTEPGAVWSSETPAVLNPLASSPDTSQLSAVISPAIAATVAMLCGIWNALWFVIGNIGCSLWSGRILPCTGVLLY